MTHSRLLIATLAFPLALFCFSSASAQTNDRAQALTEFEDLLGKMKALENRLLVVFAEDKAAFADFLNWKTLKKFPTPTALLENRSQ